MANGTLLTLVNGGQVVTPRGTSDVRYDASDAAERGIFVFLPTGDENDDYVYINVSQIVTIEPCNIEAEEAPTT